LPAAPSYTDKQLFLLIAEGDEEAFGILFNRYIEILQPFAFSITKSNAAAEEMVQETFIRIWLNRDKLTGIDNPQAWILTIASRESIGWLRKKGRDERLAKHVSKTQASSSDVTIEELRLNELKSLVNEAVELLPPQRKRIFKMSREEGMKIQEIAEALDLSVATVKNVLTTCTKQIREYLNSKGQMLGALVVILAFPLSEL
jgi:RNA polymerase sigma-70 factor (ECF subfamily)